MGGRDSKKGDGLGEKMEEEEDFGRSGKSQKLNKKKPTRFFQFQSTF